MTITLGLAKISLAIRMMTRLLVAVLLFCMGNGLQAQTVPTGVSVSYQLPVEGPLPCTYRVTLAITDPADSNWVVSTFVAGQPRVVTAENQGKFTETWEGLDDNYMPVPPGKYGVKGIFMPASTWKIDGKPHTLTAKLLGGPFGLSPKPDQDNQPPMVHGDPVGCPPGDLATAGNRAVFTYEYLENGRNNFLLDLSKPVDLNQILASYQTWGAAGGFWTATDGKTVWAYEPDSDAVCFLYRADGKKFGSGSGKYRDNVFRVEGEVVGLTALADPGTQKSYVYCAEGRQLGKKLVLDGKDSEGQQRAAGDNRIYLDRVRVLDGQSAAVLATIPLDQIGPLTARNGKLYTLQSSGDGWCVRYILLESGLPKGEWSKPIPLKGLTAPTDLDVDSQGRIYIADPKANHVYVFRADGKLVKKLGKRDAQRPGKYDKLTFMAPKRVACWTDELGKDRVIIMDKDGSSRFSEWAPDGKFFREWQGLVPRANNGYAEDPEHPGHIYIQGHGEWLLRFVVDYASGVWTLDAVWPHVTGDLGNMWRGEGSFPRIIHYKDKTYLAFGRGISIYRLDGERCVPSAAMVLVGDRKKNPKFFAWNDENGDGQMQESEWKNHPIETPSRGVFNYHGDDWQSDISLVCVGDGTRDIFRLPAAHFDSFGNPVFEKWETLLTDPILAAKAAGTATAIRGGNELSDKFTSSSWARCLMANDGDVYVNTRGERDAYLSANYVMEQKITRYVPDGKGGYQPRWRVGRSANIVSDPAGIDGSIHISDPMLGLIGIIDQTRAGVLVYTADEGLFVDRVLLDGSKQYDTVYGQPGEYFSGGLFLNKENGKVYIKWGKWTPLLFEVEGWSKNLEIRKITTLPAGVEIAANQIATPPQMALKARGGAGKTSYARFQPCPGMPPALDGSLTGWEACEPIPFGERNSKVEVRGMYDTDNLYLNWQIHTDTKINIKSLEPAERLFTHDRGADTVGLYWQGNPSATGKTPEGRPGDVRLIFGLFDQDGLAKPAALALYPAWDGQKKARPMTYGSPVGKASFANVMLCPEIKLGHVLGQAGTNLSLCAAIPRALLPGVPDLAGGLKTMVNFDANFGGNRKFWWANSDGSASRETNDEPTEARLYPGSWAPLELVPLNKGLIIRKWQVIGPFGYPKLPLLHMVNDRSEICKTFASTVYPAEPQKAANGDSSSPLSWHVDLKATYTGDIARTRGTSRALSWQPVSLTADIVDFNKISELKWPPGGQGGDEGAVYMLTWIHSPAEASVKLNVTQGSGHHAVRGWLNGVALPSASPPGKKALDLMDTIDTSKMVMLKQGWNSLLIREDHIWGNSSLGLSIEAPAAVLWSLRATNQPPE